MSQQIEGKEIINAIGEIERSRGISRDVLIPALEVALSAAYRKHYSATHANVKVTIEPDTGGLKVVSLKTAVQEVEDSRSEIAMSEAVGLGANEPGDVVEIPVQMEGFVTGRIAAQTAKQVIVQKIREAERGMIYTEFADREGEIITGVVQRVDPRNVVVEINRVEAFLPQHEQIPGERYTVGSRIKCYVFEVKKLQRGSTTIQLSRTHPNLLRKLLELEVPEIKSGLVEIKAIAREAGSRSKVAVYSHDANVDPVGACVGTKGSRIQTIVNELSNEKIDIIPWSDNIAEFVGNALSPARPLRVMPDAFSKVATVVVPASQLSLAIGREGQNARLAAKVTGWKVDIKSDAQMEGVGDYSYQGSDKVDF